MAWSQTDCQYCQWLFGAYTARFDNVKPLIYCKIIPGKAVYFSIDGESGDWKFQGAKKPWNASSLDVFERVIHFLFFFIECLHNVMKICLVLCYIPSMCIEAAKSGNKFCHTAVFNEPMVLCLKFQGPGLCF